MLIAGDAARISIALVATFLLVASPSPGRRIKVQPRRMIERVVAQRDVEDRKSSKSWWRSGTAIKCSARALSAVA